MDRITDEVLHDVIERLDRTVLVPPDDLQGDARAMFLVIAAGNKSRPWSQAHAYGLADYCRVCIGWGEEMAAIEREGRLVGGRVNPRYKVTQLLSADRLRLGKLLGLHIGARDIVLGGTGKAEQNARKIGAAIDKSDDAPGGHLLA